MSEHDNLTTSDLAEPRPAAEDSAEDMPLTREDQPDAETDPEPKPGYTMVDFPKNGSYPEVLTTLEFRRQHYAGPASEFSLIESSTLLIVRRPRKPKRSPPFSM